MARRQKTKPTKKHSSKRSKEEESDSEEIPQKRSEIAHAGSDDEEITDVSSESGVDDDVEDVMDMLDRNLARRNRKGDHAGLLARVGAVEGQEGRVGGSSGRSHLRVANEEGDEGLYGVGGGGGDLSVGALMSALEGTDVEGFRTLRRAMNEVEEEGALVAPGNSAVESRAARKVAYDLAKKQASRWVGAVAANRRAEQLVFTAETHPKEDEVVLSTSTAAAKAGVVSELELDVAAELAAAGLSHEQDARKTELQELKALPEMSVKEAKRRQGELRKLKALLFYEEEKKRRQNKIKSKAYRRIKKRERLKAEAKANELMDPEEQIEKAAYDRAKERALLRHSSRSKWIGRVLRFGGSASRKLVEERLLEAQELRRKMRQVGEEDDSEDGDEDGEEEEDEDFEEEDGKDGGVGVLMRSRRQILAEVGLDADGVTELGETGEDEQGERASGLMGMRFMQAAIDEEKERVRNDALRLAKELWQDEIQARQRAASEGRVLPPPAPFYGQVMTGDDYDDMDAGGGDGGDGGRRAFVPGQVNTQQPKKRSSQTQLDVDDDFRQDEDGGLLEDSDDEHDRQRLLNRSTTEQQQPSSQTAKSRRQKRVEFQQQQGLLDDPETRQQVRDKLRDGLLVAETGMTSGHRVQEVAGVRAGMDSTDDSNPWMRDEVGARGKQTTLRAGSKRGREEEAVELDVSRVIQSMANDRSSPPQPSPPTHSDQDDNLEDMTQEELIRRAFAGHGATMDDFAAEKRDEAEVQAKSERKKRGIAEPGEMDGWGSWTGAGSSKMERLEAKHRKRRRKTKPSTSATPAIGVTADDIVQARRDALLDHVIVNEKRDRKQAKHRPAAVPFPFRTREEYELALRQPVGREWNTVRQRDDLTKPEVIIRPGAIIEPIQSHKPAPGFRQGDTQTTSKKKKKKSSKK